MPLLQRRAKVCHRLGYRQPPGLPIFLSSCCGVCDPLVRNAKHSRVKSHTLPRFPSPRRSNSRSTDQPRRGCLPIGAHTPAQRTAHPHPVIAVARFGVHRSLASKNPWGNVISSLGKKKHRSARVAGRRHGQSLDNFPDFLP